MSDYDYCISGTDGDPCSLIDTLNLDVRAPLYIVSGEKVVKINDEHKNEINHKPDRTFLIARINIEKELFGPATAKKL